LHRFLFFGRFPASKKAGSGFSLQSFAEKAKGFSLQSLTHAARTVIYAPPYRTNHQSREKVKIKEVVYGILGVE
jgi:hypothetical protein